MSQAKIKKLSRTQYAILAVTAIALFMAQEICTRYFHLGHSNLIMFIFLVPLMFVGAYVSRNLERKSATQEFKDFLVMTLAILLTGWIPLVVLASFVHFRLSDLVNYPEFLVILIFLSVVVPYSLILTKLLRRLGYLSKPIDV